jgi:hypothetical protein
MFVVGRSFFRSAPRRLIIGMTYGPFGPEDRKRTSSWDFADPEPMHRASSPQNFRACSRRALDTTGVRPTSNAIAHGATSSNSSLVDLEGQPPFM